MPCPEHVEKVNSIPREITGLQRKYLEALERNLAARNEYNVLAHQNTIKHTRSASANNVQVARLSEHVKLLRLKERHDELRILQRCLTNLKQTNTPRADISDLKKAQEYEQAPAVSIYHHATSKDTCSDESVGSLMRKLEIAVICAEHQANRERQLLGQVQKDAEISDTSIKETNRSRAIAATRNELVAWMEDKLSNAPSGESSPEDDLLHEKQRTSVIQQLPSDILDKYSRYLDLRRRIIDLLAAISRANQRPSPRKLAPESKSVRPDQPSQSPGSSLLPFILTHIQRPTQVHHFCRQQSTHLTILSDKERRKISTELSRLADESHLLPSYPILVSQDRFKHAGSAVTSKSLSDEANFSQERNDIGRRLDAWAFAADTSRQATHEFVAANLGQGDKAVQEGLEWLGRLKDLLGENEDLEHEETGDGHGDPDEDEDVWALQAGAGQPKQAKRVFSESKGPWVGLSGDVGLRKHG